MRLLRVERPTTLGVLFALSLSRDNAIHGKVRLNKTLALLQCEGFPIKNRFINQKLGPFDGTIHSDAEILEENHHITIEDLPTGHEEPCKVYKIKEEGLRHFREQFLPRIENLPHQRAFSSRISEIKMNFSSYRTPEIVERVHRDLLIDFTLEEFSKALDQNHESLKGLMTIAERRWDHGCPICLEILGATDFAMKSIEQVIDTELDNQKSGKNMIYYNTNNMINWADKLKDHAHITDVRLKDDQSSLWREWMGHRLFCLESIGETYGIIKPLRDERSLLEYIQAVGS